MFKKIIGATLFVLTQSQIVIAQAAAPAADAPPAWMQFVPIVVIMFVFYFFLIRPQAKKQQEQKNFLTTLKSGDQVITQAGILGKISSLNENIINLEVASGVQIKILRSQVLALQNTLQTTK